ncbi:MAG: hypothetical protein A3C90_00680 [Candidatus Magasanikbacteria bacterium RIFCSPHIGHO2_02_FULL_51_14]|uniref:Uncharacterized protein n=1 Tax=Candidatus Magasanikbacteria bacterium RIFCSPHIGHO2_02_FULL_51_14 TaxID=1798683 RepID=A0A1F6MET5_9BACT|nr:MAG: hypothetical protein A3C90_00680 [Candidatus Magasanikbacteria bacterium RIFCSPHIGHO2_02_FULL_51_14]
MDGYQVFIMSEGTTIPLRQELLKILFHHLQLSETERIILMPVETTLTQGVLAWIESELVSVAGQLEDSIYVQRAPDNIRGSAFLCRPEEIQAKLPAPGVIVVVVAPHALICERVKRLTTENGIGAVGNGRTFCECI